jgi:hypothetical protein
LRALIPCLFREDHFVADVETPSNARVQPKLTATAFPNVETICE